MLYNIFDATTGDYVTTTSDPTPYDDGAHIILGTIQ